MSEWQAAYREHGPAVLRFLSRRTRRREDAEDLLQETFVRAIRAQGRLRDRSKLRAYLMSIAHNLSVNLSRRKAPVPFSEMAAAERIEAEPARGDGPEAELGLSELDERLAALLAELKPKHRTAFELAVLGGQPYREVAESTGWSLSQVKVNVYRARRAVTAGLRDLLPRDEDRAGGER